LWTISNLRVKIKIDKKGSDVFMYILNFSMFFPKKHTYRRAAFGWEHISLPKIKAVPSEGDSSPVWKSKTEL